MKQSKIYPSLVLGCICLAVALLLSVINMFTSPVIIDRANQLADSAKTEVLPGGKNFKDITADFEFPAAITEAFSADGGFVFRSTGKGRNGDIVVMIGVDSEGKVTGTKIISEGESNGYKEKVFTRVEGTDGEYTGMTLDTFAPVVSSGATLTSNGFADAMKAALQAFSIANGVAVDTRTPEEILQDNCNAALGTVDVKYARYFVREVIDGIDNVYASEGSDALVFVIGESFIGVDANGVITADVSQEDSAKASAAYAILSATTVTEVARPATASKRVTKIELTSTGNYVMYMEAAGNGINGEEWSHPSGEYITFTVSISADGKIIDVMTTYQSESKGFGDVCATDEYTEQFRGAVAGDIVITEEHMSSTSTDLGVISGSTITSNGYQQALQRAFKAFELLTTTEEGGND